MPAMSVSIFFPCWPAYVLLFPNFFGTDVQPCVTSMPYLTVIHTGAWLDSATAIGHAVAPTTPLWSRHPCATHVCGATCCDGVFPWNRSELCLLGRGFYIVSTESVCGQCVSSCTAATRCSYFPCVHLIASLLLPFFLSVCGVTFMRSSSSFLQSLFCFSLSLLILSFHTLF